MKINLLLCLALAVSSALWAGEPGPAAGEVPPSGEQPLDMKAMKEFLAKQAAEQALLDDPKSIIGTPPVFPVKATCFEDIQDDEDNLGNNFNRTTGEMELDLPALEAVLKALRASTQAHLEANVSPKVLYKDLHTKPGEHRGQVVRLQGVLKRIGEKTFPACPAGAKKLWRGEISNAQGNITSFYMLEPLPPGLTKEQSVEMVGIFLQRFSFLNRGAGEKVTWAPLVFARSIKRYSPIEEAASASNPMNSPGAIVVFIILGVGAALYCYSRSKLRTGNSNKFSRLKAEKEGPPGNFPSPGSAKKHFPQPAKKPPESV
jgi:hypothetical protein